MGNDQVDVARDGRVLIMTLDREAKRNAIDRPMADSLSAALDLLDDDDDVWVGVLAARGPVFSAGSDLTANGDYLTARGGEYGVIRRVRDKPLIAAVEGPALGGGLEIVLACDLVVASSAASFGLPEVRRGLVPSCGGLFRGPRALPLNLARQLVLTGDPIDVERAYTAGFVNEVTAPGKALEAALRLANRICDSGPVAVRACLAAVNAVASGLDEQGWGATRAAVARIESSDDAREGISAFLEKRPPRWTAQ